MPGGANTSGTISVAAIPASLPQRMAVANAQYKLVLHPTRLWNSGAADMRLAGLRWRLSSAAGRAPPPSDEAWRTPIAGSAQDGVAKLDRAQPGRLGLRNPLKKAGLRSDQDRELETDQSLADLAIGAGIVGRSLGEILLSRGCRPVVANDQ